MTTFAAIIIFALLPAWEMRAVERTASAYGLDRERTALLVAIRRAENGRVGCPSLAYGVVNAPARRSYETQCRWAANTIRRRYTGDLAAFAARWTGGVNTAVWLKNVRWFMKRQGFEK